MLHMNEPHPLGRPIVQVEVFAGREKPFRRAADFLLHCEGHYLATNYHVLSRRHPKTGKLSVRPSTSIVSPRLPFASRLAQLGYNLTRSLSFSRPSAFPSMSHRFPLVPFSMFTTALCGGLSQLLLQNSWVKSSVSH